tara:strand:- start:2236 stop:2496 length:261 start_codon:yes stop_codon:yes gene_type:complete
MAKLLLKETICQRRVHHWLNPSGHQQDPAKGNQHQHHTGDAMAGLPDRCPETKGKEQQTTVFPNGEQECSKQRHPPAAAVQEPTHN